MNSLKDWLLSRVILWRIALLFLLVTSTAWFATGGISTQYPWSWLPVMVALLIISFRLWDDLADLPFDRQQHPDRVLSRVRQLSGCHSLLWIVLTLICILIRYLDRWPTVIAYCVLVIFLIGVYRALPATGAYRTLRTHLVLLKYPGFIVLLTGYPQTFRSLAMAALLYAILVAHERAGQCKQYPCREH